MAIPQFTIDQILDRTDLVELIGQRVKLKKTGRTYSGCCPFHQEKTPSFHVYRDKGYYHCFGCQANGNAIRFLMDIDNRNFIDVMQELSSKAGIELPQDQSEKKNLSYKRSAPPPAQSIPSKNEPTSVQPQTPSSSEAEPSLESPSTDHTFTTVNEHYAENEHHPDAFDGFFAEPSSIDFSHYDDAHFSQSTDIIAPEGNLYTLLEDVARFYEQQLRQHSKAQNYFKQRSLTSQTIDFWRLGYAPEDWQHLNKAFPYDIEGLKQIGLIRTNDHGRDFNLLRDRVIFPIRDSKGRIVGFGGRALNDEIKPKYINSPDSDVFHKNQLLYGLFEGRKQNAQDWLMVEGYMDVIALQQNGIFGAVATLGTASNAEHLTTLFKQKDQINIAFDGDAAGQKAARRTLEIALPLLSDGRSLKFFVLPDEHDPDSLIRQEGVENFKKLLQQAPLLSDFIFAQLSQQYNTTHPEGKSQVMGDLRQLTDLLPKQSSFRYSLTQAFRDKLGLSRKFTPQVSHDAALSFNINTKSEDFAISILIQFPYFYHYFEPLRALMPKNELLAHILDTLNQCVDKIPEDQELTNYYILGACSPYIHELVDVLKKTQLQHLSESPEMADKVAKDYAQNLHEKYLKLKLKSPLSLTESRNLRQQLNELTKQISLKLLS